MASDGDTLDLIAWRHYGRLDGGVLAAVLEANRGLVGQGPFLSGGDRVDLPDIPEPQREEVIRLWT